MLSAYLTMALGFPLSFVLPSRSLGLPERHEVMLPVTDQFRASHVLECFAKQRPVFGIVIAKKCLVESSLLHSFWNKDVFAGPAHPMQGVFAGVIHGRGIRHRGWEKGLNLIGPETVPLEPERQVQHVFIRGPRMRRNKVGNQVLLFARFA